MRSAIEPFYVELGRRIHQLRDARKLSQEELGRQLHPPVTRASIANLETGKQRVLALTLVQFAKALGVRLQDLVPDPEQEPRASWTHGEIEHELEKELSELPKKQIKKLVSRLQQKTGGEANEPAIRAKARRETD